MRKYIIIAVLAAIGIFNAIELSIPAYQYWNGANASVLQSLPCDINSTLSCSGILQNPRAIIFAIGDFKVAFPMIALVVYPILFIIALVGWFTKKTCPAKTLTILAAGGILFNSYVIYQEFVVGVFCPLCALCTAIIIAIFFLALCIWKGEKGTPNGKADTTK
ncbi:MAG: vitamin K epoxide reductase family protein [Candidatus Gracilibacteria bacterium]|nr:vitamin K epoxide reductase family protein [Candidatus Gracilibacteria bacterium]